MLAQRVGHRSLHGIRAFAHILDHRIGLAVHHVGIVARTAQQRIDAALAVEHVRRCVADNAIGGIVAGAVDRRRAGKNQVLHIGRQGGADA